MKKNNKLQELLKNKQILISVLITLGLIVVAILQFVFK